MLTSHRGEQIATAAQAPATPTITDPVQSWLQRRAAVHRANSAHSAGPRTESGKQRSSLNALSHGLTARTAVVPTEDPDAYQRHIQQFLDEYKPATPTETQLVHEIANTGWRLNSIRLLEAELLSQAPNPQSLIPQLATLGLQRLTPLLPVPKAIDQLRYIQDERRRWSAANSLKRPNSSYAISTKDFPGSPLTMASFFQKTKSSATHDI